MMHLILHAEALGLRVIFDDLGARHAILRSDGTIVVGERIPYLLQRVALVHECGHYVRGHTHSTARDPLHLAQERQADVYAARLLISPDRYRRAERIRGTDVYALADDLDVTARIVTAWQYAYRTSRRAG